MQKEFLPTNAINKLMKTSREILHVQGLRRIRRDFHSKVVEFVNALSIYGIFWKAP